MHLAVPYPYVDSFLILKAVQNFDLLLNGYLTFFLRTGLSFISFLSLGLGCLAWRSLFVWDFFGFWLLIRLWLSLIFWVDGLFLCDDQRGKVSHYLVFIHLQEVLYDICWFPCILLPSIFRSIDVDQFISLRASWVWYPCLNWVVPSLRHLGQCGCPLVGVQLNGLFIVFHGFWSLLRVFLFLLLLMGGEAKSQLSIDSSQLLWHISGVEDLVHDVVPSDGPQLFVPLNIFLGDVLELAGW